MTQNWCLLLICVISLVPYILIANRPMEWCICKDDCTSVPGASIVLCVPTKTPCAVCPSRLEYSINIVKDRPSLFGFMLLDLFAHTTFEMLDIILVVKNHSEP